MVRCSRSRASRLSSHEVTATRQRAENFIATISTGGNQGVAGDIDLEIPVVNGGGEWKSPLLPTFGSTFTGAVEIQEPDVTNHESSRAGPRLHGPEAPSEAPPAWPFQASGTICS